ncbi:MAG: DUF58 domain-containing protein [Candidatus Hydrogenedentota bacterium]
MKAEDHKKHRIRLRPGGFIFFLIIVLLQLTAFNTGENLFYLVTAAVISIMILALLATRVGVRHLSLSRKIPESVHREEPFGSLLSLRNEQRVWPAIGLSLSADGWDKPLWLEAIAPGETVELRAYSTMVKRGLHPLPPVVVATSFPFGLFERRYAPIDRETILVYPKVYTLTKRVLDELDDSGQTPKVSFNDGDEFYSLREYVPGDDIRHISWKISARIGKLILRELEPSISRMVMLVFDTRCDVKTDYDEEQLERTMDLAASLAVSLLGLHFSVGLVLPDAQVSLGRGKMHLKTILETLALAQPQAYDAYADEWYENDGAHADASKIFLSADPSQWGVANIRGRGHIMNPDEALHG